jgi:hypothetical protein
LVADRHSLHFVYLGRPQEMIRSDRGHNERAGGDEDALAALQAHFASSFEAVPIKAVEMGKERKSVPRLKRKKEKMPLVSDAPQALRENTFSGPSRLPRSTATASKEPETVVFDGSVGRRAAGSNLSTPSDGGGWRKFMSNKVATSKDKFDEEENRARVEKAKRKAKQAGTTDPSADDDEEEKQQVTNDRALSQLLSSTLFAPETQEARKRASDGKPVLSSNATLSRLLELSQPTLTGEARSVGRGLGGSLFKATELGKMPANMRHGIRRAQKEKQGQELEKAKELGIYHQSIKGLLGRGAEGSDLVQGSREKDRKARSRQKGLSMGVGRFKDGELRLSKDEVHRINASGENSKKGAKRRKQ